MAIFNSYVKLPEGIYYKSIKIPSIFMHKKSHSNHEQLLKTHIFLLVKKKNIKSQNEVHEFWLGAPRNHDTIFNIPIDDGYVSLLSGDIPMKNTHRNVDG